MQAIRIKIRDITLILLALIGITVMYSLNLLDYLSRGEFILGVILILYFSGAVLLILRNLFDNETAQTRAALEEIRQTMLDTNNISFSFEGIDRVYKNQSQAFSEIPSIVSSAKRYVCILTVSRISIYWGPSFEEDILAVAERGLQLNILLPDPYSLSKSVGSTKSQRIEVDYMNRRDEIMLDIKRWEKVLKNIKGSKDIQIRYYDFLPTASMVITDDFLILSPELYSSSLLSSPAIRANRGVGSMYETYLSYFESVWKESRVKY